MQKKTEKTFYVMVINGSKHHIIWLKDRKYSKVCQKPSHTGWSFGLHSRNVDG